MLRKTLYLANPYGFSDQSKQGPLAALVDALAAAGAKVWEPFARNNRTDRTRSGWAYRIGQADLGDVRAADGLFAVVNGCPPDEGVMVELGFAIAWGKPTFLFRDDYRRCAERGVSTELDAVRRPAGVRLGSVLVHLAWGDCRSRQGAPSLAEILTLPGVLASLRK